MTTLNISLEQWYEEHAVIYCLLEILCWSCYLYVLVCTMVMLSRLWTLIENLERNLFCVRKYFYVLIYSIKSLFEPFEFIYFYWMVIRQYAWSESQPSPSTNLSLLLVDLTLISLLRIFLDVSSQFHSCNRNYPFSCIHLPPSLSYCLKST